MAAKSLRRLAADHASLHNAGLPPNYLWPPHHDSSSDDLTSLSVLLAGPEGTPYSSGLFALSLSIPPTYPAQPPTATFKTRIWHPNIDEATGAVCVETLKRDWRPELTLRDVLVTIGCLLIQPNPASALNGEAGRLCEGDWGAFERRARMMVGVYARVPEGMVGMVEEARRRGEGEGEGQHGDEEEGKRGKAKGKGKRKVGAGARGTEDGGREEERVGTQAARRKPFPDTAIETTRPPAPLCADPFAARVTTALAVPPPTATGTFAAGEAMPLDDPRTPIRTNPKRHALSPPTPINHHPKNLQTPLSTPLRPTAATNACPHQPRSFFQTPVKPSAASTTLNTPCNNSGKSSKSSDRFGPGVAALAQLAGAPEYPAWMDWLAGLQVQRGETAAERVRRERMEMRRLKAAGGDLGRYNRGTFGPRRGLKRL